MRAGVARLWVRSCCSFVLTVFFAWFWLADHGSVICDYLSPAGACEPSEPVFGARLGRHLLAISSQQFATVHHGARICRAIETGAAPCRGVKAWLSSPTMRGL